MAFFIAATTTNKIENYTTPGDVTFDIVCKSPPSLAQSLGHLRAHEIYSALRVHAVLDEWAHTPKQCRLNGDVPRTLLPVGHANDPTERQRP